jgi:pimeloyl-ACP methyl ester carboxylesterase
LRGAENAPAVVLLHRYGADRSHVLNLGVKLNEATNFTVLMPDARGHGEKPAVKIFVRRLRNRRRARRIDFLRDLKSASNKNFNRTKYRHLRHRNGRARALSAAAQRWKPSKRSRSIRFRKR